MENIIFRKIASTDRESFMKYCDEFYHSSAVLHTIPTAHMEKTFNEIINGTPYADCYMIEYDGKTCGYVLLAITFSNEAGGKVIWIEELYVEENMRGKGIAHEFFDFIKKEASAALRLEVEPLNTRAVKLYKALGFERLDYTQYILK